MTDFITTVITVSIMGSIAAIATGLIKSVLSGRLSAKAGAYIWLPVILRLICPYIPKSNMSLYNHLPENSVIYKPATINVITPSDNTALEIRLLPYLWLAGAILVTVIFVASHFKFIKSIVKSTKPCKHSKNILKHAADTAGLKKNLETVICENNVSPMIIGFIKPKLIIPEILFENFSAEQAEQVLIHELIHYKRKHRYINLVLTAINCIHWFNPIVWYTTSQIKKEPENVCDEIAVKLIGKDSKYIYSKTLIDLSELLGKTYSPLTVSPMASSKKTLKSRIKNIYNISKRKINIVALPLCIIIVVTLLTGATEKQAIKAADTIVKKAEPYTTIQASSEIQQSSEAYTENPQALSPQISENQISETTADIQYKYSPNLYESYAVNSQTSYPTGEDASGVKTNDNTASVPATPAIQPEVTPETSNEKTYTYTSGNATASFSNDPNKSGFVTDTGELKIETTGIISSDDESLNGYFNVYRNGELIEENIRANVSANADSIHFDAVAGSDDYQFDVSSKTIE